MIKSGCADRSVIWTSDQAASATGGTAVGRWQVTGVSIDTRTLQRGDLFVALAGSQSDGHQFIDKALEGGAAGVCVSTICPHLPKPSPLLVVKDTTKALYDLGLRARQQSSAKIVAVTGSVGKTTTKQMLVHILSQQGITSGSFGNHNNQLGVPLSLARLPAAADFGVFELGMSRPGEIAQLTQQVRPAVGIITAIAPAHLEAFRNLDEIARAKAELFQGMEPEGTVILNCDQDTFPLLSSIAIERGLKDIRTFSSAQTDVILADTPVALAKTGTSTSSAAARGSSARVISCQLSADSSFVRADIRGRQLCYRLSVPGRHQVMNSLAALLATEALGADIFAAAQALGEINPVKGRGSQILIAPKDGGQCRLIDDSYNASPSSVEAALATMAVQQPQADGRRVLVLGDMLELGSQTVRLHLQLLEPLLASGVEQVFCCGEMMGLLYTRLPARLRAGYARDSTELAPMVKHWVRDGDVILVKGSAQSAMSKVVSLLQEDFPHTGQN